MSDDEGIDEKDARIEYPETSAESMNEDEVLNTRQDETRRDKSRFALLTR